jgi:predicted Zn-ribbon and HTH transcriptional regulator
MAIKKSTVKVFNAKYIAAKKSNYKCKRCGLVYIGNEQMFVRNKSRCNECKKKDYKEKRKQIKKRNIWGL